jgi:hypothetical protein
MHAPYYLIQVRIQFFKKLAMVELEGIPIAYLGTHWLSFFIMILYKMPAIPTMTTKINKILSSIFSSIIVVWFIVKTAIRHNLKSRATLFPRATRLPLQYSGNPAISLRPVAFRPLLAKGLALS